MWSKAIFRRAGHDAFDKMNANLQSGCFYHNSNHILEMYDYLERSGEPYSEVLDYAVMFHDVVYDKAPDKEFRSAEFMRYTIERYGFSEEFMTAVHQLIMATKDHLVDPSVLGWSAIVRADLHGLSEPEAAPRDYSLILGESMTLYGLEDPKEFAKNSLEFMGGLFDRVGQNINLDPKHADFYRKVLDGIRVTNKLSAYLLTLETE